MRSKKQYWSPVALPPRLPGISGLTLYLGLEHFAAPGWMYGVVGALIGILTLGFFIKIFTYKSVELPRE